MGDEANVVASDGSNFAFGALDFLRQLCRHIEKLVVTRGLCSLEIAQSQVSGLLDGVRLGVGLNTRNAGVAEDLAHEEGQNGKEEEEPAK